MCYVLMVKHLASSICLDRKTIEKQQMNAKMNYVCEQTLNPGMCT